MRRKMTLFIIILLIEIFIVLADMTNRKVKEFTYRDFLEQWTIEGYRTKNK